jgi:hypothetical protein
MTPKQRYSLILTVIIIGAGSAASLLVWVFGWPLIIIRDNQYRKLIEDYHQASRIDKKGVAARFGNDFQIKTPGSHGAALIQVPASIGVVSIKYDDENSSRSLYRYAEYSSPIEIKTNGTTVYIYWVEPLFGDNYWILAYDLANRREIIRRKVDPEDL